MINFMDVATAPWHYGDTIVVNKGSEKIVIRIGGREDDWAAYGRSPHLPPDATDEEVGANGLKLYESEARALLQGLLDLYYRP